jgi:predicted nucleic acid-binding protein
VVKRLFDTNILVDALRGLPVCEDYLSRLTEGDHFCSTITSAELWAGVRPADEDDLDIFLGAFQWIPVDEPIARQAGHYMQKYSKSHGLTLPDALIAATARSLEADMMTLNIKHFPMKDLKVVAPY